MYKLVRPLILITFLLLSWSSFAIDHVIDWLPKGASLRHRINLDTRNLETETAVDQWKIVRPIVISEDDRNTLITKYYRADYFFLNQDLIRFAVQGTGIVFDFHVASAQVNRIDQTLHSGYNFSAIRFFRNNIIYSIGGEGFWGYNRQITYFDDRTTKEWELFRPKNKGPEHISAGFQGYSAKEDAFYSGGGTNKNFLEDEKITFERDFYKFSFKTKTWELLGEISSKISLEELL